jgi:trehalose synthase
MVEMPKVEEAFTLQHYESRHQLMSAVTDLRMEAAMTIPLLRGRTLWMINSTSQGGGVAEMLPKMIALLGELGLEARWLVMATDDERFYELTKRLHNLIHGEGRPDLSENDRRLYDAVSRENADKIRAMIGPDDLVVIHDPQPMGIGALLKKEVGMPLLWRCHIGLDEHLPQTSAAWRFLEPYAGGYDHAVFSAPEYIPDFLAGRSTIIHPALDPESHKNRDLSPHKLVGILCNSGLKYQSHPVSYPPFEHQAQRLWPDGSWGPAVTNGNQMGLLYRPVVTQVSRWDRLKGFAPLLQAFIELKRRLDDPNRQYDEHHRRQLEIARLVLAGPDPSAVADDPEGQEVLEELKRAYVAIPDRLKQDVVLLSLPMHSRKQNALMCNALQRCATVAVQNSLREGFGLTATEAMLKGIVTLGTHACGLRQQIRPGVDGLLTRDPTDSLEIADKLDRLLQEPMRRSILSRNAQRRVYQEFLVFGQVAKWLRLLAETVEASRSGSEGEPTGRR